MCTCESRCGHKCVCVSVCVDDSNVHVCINTLCVCVGVFGGGGIYVCFDVFVCVDV